MLIFLMLGIEIMLFAIGYLLFEHDIFQPSLFMIAVFILSTSVAAMNVKNWNMTYSSLTVLVMMSGFICALLANALAIYVTPKREQSSEQLTSSRIDAFNVSGKLIFVVVIFEVIVLLLYYREIVRIATAAGYVPGSNLLWHYRNGVSYEATETLNKGVALLTRTVDAIGYVFVFLIIEYVFSKKVKTTKLISMFAPVFLYVVKVLMSSGRLDILKLFSFALVVAYILKGYETHWDKHNSAKFIRTAVMMVPAIFILFYLATSLIGRKTTRSMFDYISTYAGGSIQQFNQFLDDAGNADAKPVGFETFPGIYSFLRSIGKFDDPVSVHLEFRQLGITKGNVYTFFRRPYHDFGFIGMCLMTFVVVFIFSMWYARIKQQSPSKSRNSSIIVYSYLFYWISFSSIEQYSLGIISIGEIFSLLALVIVYYAVTQKISIALPIKEKYMAQRSCH